MKFIVFWEFSREDTDKIIPKFQKWREGLKKNPEKHLKSIFPAHHLSEPTETGKTNGISIYETDDEEKIIDYIVSYFPEMSVKIVPLLDSAKVQELYLKTKK